MAVLYQIIATTIVCFPCLNMGVMYAWPSSTVLLFTSPNTTLDRPMSELEVSLFGSMSSVGAMVGTVVTAALLDRIGRKWCTVLAGCTSVISWAIIACTSNVGVVLTAVFISGLSGASFLIVPVFVSEFCQKSIRGTMTSGSMVFYGVGMLISYLLGGYLDYLTMIYIAMASATLEVMTMAWLKESPVYLMKNGLGDEAAKSVAFYRQVSVGSKIVIKELGIVRRALYPEVTDSIDEVETLQPMKTDVEGIGPREIKIDSMGKIQQKLSVWQFFRRSGPTQRGLLITLVLMSAAILQGLVVVQVYAEPLFAEAVPVMSATLCSVLFAVSIVLASFAAAYMSDIAGRRPLMIYSSLGSCACCLLLGSQLQMAWAPSWLTAAIMYLFCAVYSFGGGTVPFVLLAEVFLPEVKSFMTMLVVEWMWVCSFLILLIFNPLVAAIGLGPVFYIFAVICLLSAVFSVFYVPETKGHTLDVVQTLLTQKSYF